MQPSRSIIAFISYLLYNFPRVYQSVQRPCGVGRRGGRKNMGSDTGNGFGIFVIIFFRSLAVDEYFFYGSFLEYGAWVIGNHIFYRAVRAAFYVAGGYYIPEGYAVSQEKASLFFYGIWQRTLKDRRCNFPKPVLGMTVKKQLLSGLYGRKRSQYEYF